MTSLVNNFRLAFSTVVEHFADDPVVLILQVSRRLPASVVRRAARLLFRLPRRRTGSVTAALAAYALGDTTAMLDGMHAALRAGASGRRTRMLAEVALAASEPEMAEHLLAAAPPDTPHLAGTRARLAWYHGRMSDAVAALEGGGRTERTQRRRLAGELRTFQGQRPGAALPPATGGAVPRRVLHLLTNSLPHTGSGYAQRSHSILAAQQALGWQAAAVTRLGYPVQVGRLLAAGQDVIDGVTYHRLLPPVLKPTFDERLAQQTEALARIAADFQPEILHTTTHFVNGLVTREVAEQRGIPWVYEVRGQLADTWASTRSAEARRSERYRLFQERETEVMAAASLVVTLGESMRNDIIGRGIEAEKILICPNAVGEEFLADPLPHAEARSRVGLPVDGLLIGTVSSLVPYEGLEDLVDAFAILAPRHPNLRLLVVGDGVSAPALRLQAARTGVSDRVIFTGRVPRRDAVLYHQALDVFVVPRRDLDVTRSVTPLKPVEASASARPVVASRLPALAELVHHGVTGTLAPPDDSAALAEALDVLLRDEGLRRRYGNAGREWALADRTWQANARRYVAAYDRLAGRNR